MKATPITTQTHLWGWNSSAKSTDRPLGLTLEPFTSTQSTLQAKVRRSLETQMAVLKCCKSTQKRGAFSLANVVPFWGSTLCVSRVPQPPDLILYALQQVKATFAGSITNRRR
jgi:hypothetical protein